MRTNRFRLLSALAAASLTFTIASIASADPRPAPPEGDRGYAYNFGDDPLAAGGFGPNDAILRVRPGAARATLVRPRTSFVPELLKSVELF